MDWLMLVLLACGEAQCEERHAQLAEIASGYEAKALSEQSQRMTGEA